MSRVLPAVLTLLIGLPLAGYLWPDISPQDEPQNEPAWHWPQAATSATITSMPDPLLRFWPGKLPVSEQELAATKAAAERAGHAWALVGIIRQGPALNALVLDPQKNILTVKAGDRLDEQRQVLDIQPTYLQWVDHRNIRGVLPLYPEPGEPHPDAASAMQAAQ